MKPAAFEYHAPDSAQEVVSLLAELGEDAKVIAGGQSLVPVLAMRLAVFGHLIDIRRVAGLRGVERVNGSVRIGAGTTQAAIEGSSQIATAVPLIAYATPLIGHFQIRNRGTIGGSLAHADAAAEYPAVALALGARMETLSPRGSRTIGAADFFTGVWSTALAADELLTGVTFPAAAGRSGFAIEEFAARRGDFALAGAAVAVELDDDGTRVRRCGIGLFGLGATAVRAEAAEAAVTGSAVTGSAVTGSAVTGSAVTGSAVDGGSAEDIGHAAVSALESVPSDLHADAGYRKRVGAAMVAAAWQRAIREAVNG